MNYAKKLLSIFIILLFLNPLFYAQIEDENFEESGEFCEISKLTQKEVQKFLNMRKDGIMAENLMPKEVEKGKKLAKNSVLVSDEKLRFATQIDLPKETFKPKAASWILGNQIQGGFSLGLVLDDTVRVGRCSEDFRDANACPVEGGLLALRNDGASFKSDLKNAWSALKELFTGKKQTTMTKEELERFRESIESYGVDLNDVNLRTVYRKPSEIIPNAIEAETFSAKMETMSDKHTTISIYSLFDKYFNAFFSTEMVASLVGPTFWGVGKRLWTGIKTTFEAWLPLGATRVKTLKKLDALLRNPESIIGKWRISKLGRLTKKYPEIEQFKYAALVGHGGSSGYFFIKGGSFKAQVGKWLADDGILGQIKNPKLRRAIADYIGTLEGFLKNTKNLADLAQLRYQKMLAEAAKIADPVARRAKQAAARVEYGRAIAKLMQNVDDIADLDLPEYFFRKAEFGFINKGVKVKGTDNIVSVGADSTWADVHIYKPFIDDEYGKWWKSGLEVTDTGDLVLYEMVPKGQAKTFALSDLDSLIEQAKSRKLMVQLEDGRVIPISSSTAPIIKEKAGAYLKVYEGEGWRKVGALTSEDFANTLTESYAVKRMFDYAPRNAEYLRHVLTEKGYVSRRWSSLLDKLFAQETHLLWSYLSKPKTAITLTVAPFAYWWARRGFGYKEASFYMLPEEWTSLELYLGKGKLYEDAFLEFFGGGRGSDQGDLFLRVINYLPVWKWILDAWASATDSSLKETYYYVTGQGRRDIVKNLLFYLQTPTECSGCTITINAPEMRRFNIGFKAPQNVLAYIQEETLANEKKLGELLVAFAHHMNMRSDEGKNIDLEEAIKNKETCTDKVKNLKIAGVGIPVTWGANMGKTVGGVLAFSESLVYLAAGWPGIFYSLLMQLAVAPQLQGCIDTEEGYYIHFFRKPPLTKETDAERAKKELNRKVAEGAEKVSAFLQGAAFDKNSSLGKSMEKMDKYFKNFIKKAKYSGIVQASLSLAQPSGTLSALRIFYLWLQPGFEMSKSYYDTKSEYIMKGKDAKGKEFNVEVSNKEGTIKLNGKEILQKEDHTRLSSLNGKIPALEIPQTIGKISLDDVNELFEIDIRGNVFVKDSDVLDCIKDAVEQQTGLSLDSDNLALAFGKLQSLVTSYYNQIKFLPDQKRIVAEGTPRMIFRGKGTKVFINGLLDVNILEEKKKPFYAGKMLSLQFENGVIIYKPKTNQLLVWLKHHEEGKLHGSEIVNMKSKLTSFKNPETDCEEYAIDFSVIGDPRSERLTHKAEQFTKSLQHMGPFQIFDTDKQTIIFYTELTPDGECINRIRVIDKETGQVYDAAISRVEDTPEGVKIHTADGKTHDLKFSFENGKPILTYNGVPNVITSMQGRHGSFYYDPKTGMWYAENSQLIPLVEAFRRAGLEFKADKDGNPTAQPNTNFLIMSQQPAAGGLLANLPSLPENKISFIIYLLLMLSLITAIYYRNLERIKH